MSDENDTLPGVAKSVAEGLNRLLGGDYQPDTLKDDLSKRLHNRLVALELRRQQNIEAVARAAFDAADADSQDVANKGLDDDWMMRFIDHAQDVGNADMQQVWGRVLADEASSPGRFTLQALDSLADMSPDDIALCGRVRRLTFPTGYLMKVGGRNEFDAFGVSADDLDRLRALDFIQEADDLGVTFYAPTRGLTFDYKGYDLVVRHPESQLFTLNAFKLTAVGTEVITTLADDDAHTGYLLALAKDLYDAGYEAVVRPSRKAAA